MRSVTRVLVLHASPRKGKNSDSMLDAFLASASDNNAYDVEHIYVPQLKLSPCISCFSCKTKGVCPIPDDMQRCYQLVSDADIIVIGSPVYFNGVPAWFKVFIDRCQPFYYHEMKPKTGYLLACCDEGKADPFIGVQKTVEAFFYCINAKLQDHYYCVLNGKQFNELVAETEQVLRFGCATFLP